MGQQSRFIISKREEFINQSSFPSAFVSHKCCMCIDYKILCCFGFEQGIGYIIQNPSKRFSPGSENGRLKCSVAVCVFQLWGRTFIHFSEPNKNSLDRLCRRSFVETRGETRDRPEHDSARAPASLFGKSSCRSRSKKFSKFCSYQKHRSFCLNRSSCLNRSI